jgi:hypothetical protein
LTLKFCQTPSEPQSIHTLHVTFLQVVPQFHCASV